MVRPVASKHPITLGYRQKMASRPSYIHRGIDYGCPTGTSVIATKGGKVIAAGRSGGYGTAYGIQVVVLVDGIYCLYAHLSKVTVKVGQTVKTGQEVGKSGATGDVTGPHLHYQENTQKPAAYKSDRNPKFTSWTDPAPAKPLDKMDPANYPPKGPTSGDQIMWLGQRLVAHGFDRHYKVGPSKTWGEADRKNVEDFQKAQGWTGTNADGYPGKETLKRLAADPKPEPSEVPLTWAFRAATVNTITQRLSPKNTYGHASWVKGKAWDARAVGLANDVYALRCSVVATQEAGTNKEADVLDRAMEKKSGGKWSHRLHGAAGGITNTVTVQNKRTEVKGYRFAVSGSDRVGVGSLLRDEKTGGLVLFVSCHPIPGGRGGENDNVRYRWTLNIIEQALAAAKADAKEFKTKRAIPIVFIGDWNQDANDKNDGVAKAMAKYGFYDAETLVQPTKNVNAKWPTLNDLKTTPYNGNLRYDRAFVKKGETIVHDIETIWSAPNSDHNMVGFGFEVPNTAAAAPTPALAT